MYGENIGTLPYSERKILLSYIEEKNRDLINECIKRRGEFVVLRQKEEVRKLHNGYFSTPYLIHVEYDGSLIKVWVKIEGDYINRLLMIIEEDE